MGAFRSFASAQASIPAEVVKAGFLLNFARFAEWPSLASTDPIVLCIVGDDRIAAALVETVKDQSIGSHPLEVRRNPESGTWRACQVLHIADGSTRRSAGGLAELTTMPVLTVSDGKGFSATGGIIEFVLDGSRMRFAINVDGVKRSGLRLSSRLLGVATIVRTARVQ